MTHSKADWLTGFASVMEAEMEAQGLTYFTLEEISGVPRWRLAFFKRGRGTMADATQVARALRLPLSEMLAGGDADA